MRHGTTDQGRRRCNRRRSGRRASRRCPAGATGAGSFAGTCIFGLSARRPDRFRILDPQRWQIQLLLFVCKKERRTCRTKSYDDTRRPTTSQRCITRINIEEKVKERLDQFVGKRPIIDLISAGQPLHWPAPFFYSSRLPEHTQSSNEYWIHFLNWPGQQGAKQMSTF